MKKIVLSAGLLSVLSVSSVQADDFTVTPLVGFDLGVNYFTANARYTAVDNDNVGALGGFKIGARNEHYRIYFDAKAYFVPDFDYVNSFGGQIQYLYPMSDDKAWEMYFGGNVGIMNMQYEDPYLQSKRTISQLYLGFDLGVNYTLNDTVSFEMGFKYMNLGISHTLQLANGTDVTHTIAGMPTLMGSIVFALDTEKSMTR